MKRYKAQQV